MQVLQNDVQSHARSVEAVSAAGRGLLSCSAGDGAEGLRRGLQELQRRWEAVRAECERRELRLQQNLRRLRAVGAELQELLQWLEAAEAQLRCCGDPQSCDEELTALQVTPTSGAATPQHCMPHSHPIVPIPFPFPSHCSHPIPIPFP